MEESIIFNIIFLNDYKTPFDGSFNIIGDDLRDYLNPKIENN